MIECPKCHKDLPDDSEFCIYCGRNLKHPELSEGKEAVGLGLKENPRKNNLGRFSILLLILVVVVFDFALGTLFNSLGWNIKIIFWISFVLYLLCIAMAVFSMYVDSQDKKNGYEPTNETGLAIAAIVFAIVIILMNLQGVLL